jgi:serine protease DegQ
MKRAIWDWHTRVTSATSVALALLFLVGVSGAIDPAVGRGPILDESRGVLTLAPMLEAATPAVVNIAVLTRAVGDDNPLLRDPFFRRYFGLPDQGVPERRSRSAGSGVIIDAAKGYIVTNHHVVKDAELIAVTLKDGRQIEARLVGSDAGTDIALVKIPPQGLSALSLGNSDELKVGDVVLAVGNPFGLGQTVTSGIVSALGRSGLSSDAYEDFIQTDAPINPGNTGGALVNSKGELIGINSAILAPNGGNVGIGFAVPVNMMKAVVSQLEKFGAVKRGRIGVSLQTVTPTSPLHWVSREQRVRLLAQSIRARRRKRPASGVVIFSSRSTAKPSLTLRTCVTASGCAKREAASHSPCFARAAAKLCRLRLDLLHESEPNRPQQCRQA